MLEIVVAELRRSAWTSANANVASAVNCIDRVAPAMIGIATINGLALC